MSRASASSSTTKMRIPRRSAKFVACSRGAVLFAGSIATASAVLTAKGGKQQCDQAQSSRQHRNRFKREHLNVERVID